MMSSSKVHHGWRCSYLFLDLLHVMSLFVLPQPMGLLLKGREGGVVEMR